MIQIENLNVAKSRKEILKDINLSIHFGSVTTILGRNGSGKSTLLKAIAGLETFNGRISAPPFAPYLPAYSEMVFDFQVRDMILAGRYLIHRGYPTKEAETECLHQLSFFNMESLWKRNLFDLSSGERQLVFAVRALSSQAKFLCFDEPFSHLDIGHELKLRERIRVLSRSGIGILLAEHHLMSAIQFADHLIFIDAGKIMAQLPAKDPKIKSTLEKTFGVSMDDIS